MKLLYVDVAKVTWLFDTRLINPKGLSQTLLFDGLKEQYKFAKSPAHAGDLTNNALVFEHGAFVKVNGESIHAQLSIYNDGIVAETASCTDDTMEFIKSLCEWAVKAGYSLPSEGMVRFGFANQVRVLCETPLLAINPTIESLIRLLESRFQSLDNKPRVFDLGAIHLFSEDVSKPLAPVPFRFERKYGAPFSSNEYFSLAPLRTQDHLDLLEELEKILKV
jgi:hypothetical protein